MGVVSSIASLISSAVSIDNNRKAKKEAKRQQAEIDRQKQQELNKRKQLIDQQRYNLLGSNKNNAAITNNTSGTGNYSLLDNNKTLG